uniref:aspartate-alanine antiporter-like transporter n=1 Tax=Thermacetogenium phaeum TaxID=85874 RepID=UPI0038B52E08
MLGEFIDSIIKNEFFILFLTTALGLLLGKLKIKGVGLETSGTLFVGIIAGALGCTADKALFQFSLVLFISAVGLLAAEDIGRVMRLYGWRFLFLGAIITFSGALATYLLTLLCKGEFDPYLVAGTYTGALTSSPGLAAALEATGGNPNITVGHAVAYPFGVLLVILFVQLAPVIFKIDVKRELEVYRKEMKQVSKGRTVPGGRGKAGFDLIGFAFVIAAGIIIGSIPIPVPGLATSIKLEITGGVLISALVLGYLGRIGPFTTRMSAGVLSDLRELGLALFLAIVGIQSGAGVVEVLGGQGIILCLIALAAGIVAELVGFLVGRYLWKINWILLSGAICGGMTSTPGLGAAVDAAGTDEVATGYGATYPAALLFMVIWTILLHTLLG